MYMYIRCREKELEGHLANWEDRNAVGDGGGQGKARMQSLSVVTIHILLYCPHSFLNIM